MTAGVEAPVAGRGPRVASESEALFGRPRSRIDQWISLDADTWHHDRSSRRPEPVKSRPSPYEAVPTSSPTAARPRTALGASVEDASPAICDVLAAWRAAERELVDLDENDPEWSRVHAEFVGLRALHHRLFEARMGPGNAGGGTAATGSASFLTLGPPVLATV